MPGFPDQTCNREESVYGKARELLPTDAMTPLGKDVAIASY